MPDPGGAVWQIGTVMRVRKAIAAAIGVSLVGLLAVLVWPRTTVRLPPTLNIVSMEPAEIVDDDGEDMWLVTLGLRNLDSRPPSPENCLNVKNAGGAIEAKVANRWVQVEGALDCGLAPGGNCERLFLMPARIEGCRVSLKYTGSRLVGGQLWRLSLRLPEFVRFRMSHEFWRWVGSFGMPHYVPSLHWREISVELPLPSTSTRPASISGEAHNPPSAGHAELAFLFAAGHRRFGAPDSER